MSVSGSYKDEAFLLGEVPSVDALLGEVIEVREHNSRAHYTMVYIWDERKESKTKAHHDAKGTWICYYCKPDKRVLKAFSGTEEHVMVGRDGGDFALATLKVIPWHDGTVRLFGRAVQYPGEVPLAYHRELKQ